MAKVLPFIGEWQRIITKFQRIKEMLVVNTIMVFGFFTTPILTKPPRTLFTT
jgi:hypothetical protein